MLLKFYVSALVAYGAVQVAAHAAIAPALGVQGTPARSNVQRPSTNKPCGNQALSAMDTSQAVIADASGNFQVSITNFNGGQDGSRQVTMKVDTTGTGKSLVDGTVSQNGQKAPKGTGTEQITAALPADAACAGGASKNKCLASFTTAGGFGNCVVVQQGGTAGNASTAAAPTTGATATDGQGNNQGKGNAANNGKTVPREISW